MSGKRMGVLVALLIAVVSAWAGNLPYGNVTPPQPRAESGKIEVIEFFSYGCPHCYHLDAGIVAWRQKLSKDVVFKRIPAVPSSGWEPFARLFYTLEAMNLLEKFHPRVFAAIHKDNVNLANARLRDEWLRMNGIDVAAYKATEESFAVQSKVAQARQTTLNYKVDGVPRMVVNGRYFTDGEMAGGIERTLPVVDQMIELERRASKSQGAR